MKIYFPQWQGSGTGIIIKSGAKTILDYLNDESFIEIPLSIIPAGQKGTQKHHINNYDALVEQLNRFKETVDTERPKTIKTIGGDCGLEIIPVSYLNYQHKNLGVLWFDAHADINRPCDSNSCNFHGMPLRTLLGEGEPQMNPLLFSKINPSQIHYIGLRDIDLAEQKRIEEGKIYAPKTINHEELIQVLKKKHIEKLYLHFDFDCLDPSAYGETYYQVAKGITIKEAEDCIMALKDQFEIVGSSVLESITTAQNELKPINGIIDLLMD